MPKQNKDYKALFAERYILEGFVAFQESADLMRKAMDMLGGFHNLYFDDKGSLHSKLSDGTMSAEEKEKLFSMILHSWDIISDFTKKMDE